MLSVVFEGGVPGHVDGMGERPVAADAQGSCVAQGGDDLDAFVELVDGLVVAWVEVDPGELGEVGDQPGVLGEGEHVGAEQHQFVGGLHGEEPAAFDDDGTSAGEDLDRGPHGGLELEGAGGRGVGGIDGLFVADEGQAEYRPGLAEAVVEALQVGVFPKKWIAV